MRAALNRDRERRRKADHASADRAGAGARSAADRAGEGRAAASAIRFPNRSFIAEWNALLELPAGELRSRLTSPSHGWKRLRLSSPFVTAAGVDFTDAALRRRIACAAKRFAARISGHGDARQTAVSRPPVV